MLRDMKIEELPGYKIALERGEERGMQRGISQGISQGMIQTAITMIKEFNLSIEAVARKLNISIDELKKHLH